MNLISKQLQVVDAVPDPTSGDEAEPPRKRLRVGHASERGAVNAVRTLFEASDLVVDEVDGRNDYGRDMTVDITERREITGAVIGIQAKGDRRFVREVGPWELTASARDLRYWAESSVPVLGVLWDPESKALRWANLTAHARTDWTVTPWSPREQSPNSVPFPVEQVLSEVTLADALDHMRQYVRRTTSDALLGLFDSVDDNRMRAVQDCWILGRGDTRAFLLLRHSLSALRGESVLYAIAVLSHSGSHPDIFWSARNWIPTEVKARVRNTFRWSPVELLHLVAAVEHGGEESLWQRGGLGQSLWVLLAEDPDLQRVVPLAIPLALENDDLDSAFRLLAMHQYLADDALIAAREVVRLHPALQAHPYLREFLDQIATFGFVDLF